MDNSIQITIPNKYHAQFKDGVLITRGKNKFFWFFSKRTLWLFTKEDWNKILIATDELMKNFNFNKSKLFYKILTSGIFKTIINRQGKIIIPNYLCKYANIKNDKIKITSDDGKLIIKTI